MKKLDRLAQWVGWTLKFSGCSVWLVMLCSCKKPGLLVNERQGKIDFSTFIASQIVKYGGSNTSLATGIAPGITSYVYSDDENGFQVVCVGNKVAALRNLFQPAFGDPALTATNVIGL